MRRSCFSAINPDRVEVPQDLGRAGGQLQSLTVHPAEGVRNPGYFARGPQVERGGPPGTALSQAADRAGQLDVGHIDRAGPQPVHQPEH